MTMTLVSQWETIENRGLYVRGVDDDDVLVDPTSFPVEVSFAPIGQRPTVWTDAAWVSGGPVSSPIGEAYRIDVVVGPTGSGAAVELERGRYNAYVKVTADDETPVLAAGALHLV